MVPSEVDGDRAVIHGLNEDTVSTIRPFESKDLISFGSGDDQGINLAAAYGMQKLLGLTQRSA